MIRTGPRRGCRPALLAALAGLAACRAEEPQTGPLHLVREGRFGSLRDLVLFERGESAGGPFFLDRFEVTRDDWNGFAAATGAAAQPVGPGEAALPATGIDLREARAFAHWRFCRLPRSDEWLFAATADGRFAFPWGSHFYASRANTSELGLGQPSLVGIFESGRRGEGPYDLIGNASEWTESVPIGWFRGDADVIPDVSPALWKLNRTPALRVWLLADGVASPCWLVQALGRRVPREAVGSDYLASKDDLLRRRFPGDRPAAQGLRLAADPRGICLALATWPEQPRQPEREQLRRFLQRGRHAGVLAPAWRLVRADLARRGVVPGPLAAVLDAELP